MPIEELLAMYNCVTPPIQTFVPSGSGSKRRSKTSRNAGLDKTLMPPPETPKTIGETSTSNERVKDDVKSEDAATAETENKPTENAESAETATATSVSVASSAITTPPPSPPIKSTETARKTQPVGDDTHKDAISTDTPKKSKTDDDDNDGDDKHKKSDTTKQTSSKTSDIKEELTESNTSDKENNEKEHSNLNTDAATPDSGHENSASTKATTDTAESSKNTGNYFNIYSNKMQPNERTADFSRQ